MAPLQQVVDVRPRVRSTCNRVLWLCAAAAVAMQSVCSLGGCFVTNFSTYARMSAARRLRSQGRARSKGVARKVTVEPPVNFKPPEIDDLIFTGGQSPWLECVVEQCHQSTCVRMESWVFRREHVDDYGHLLMQIRNMQSDVQVSAAVVTCHDHRYDVTLQCSQCVKMVVGGPYGSRGIAVGTFPPEHDAATCLSASKSLPASESLSGERQYGQWEEPRQRAFCNTMNARFLTAP